MYNSLYKYLIFYKRLNLPNIGSFTVEHVPGRLDFLNKQLHSPIPVIRFSPDKNAAAEQQLFEFLAVDMGISELEAIKQFNDLSTQLKADLNQNSVAPLPGIGTLQKEFGDNYTFQPKASIQQYFPDAAAERVVRKEAIHTVRVGEDERSSDEMKGILADDETSADKWWMYALILGILGLGALVYYYMTHR
jgi:hypothetical protein